LKSLANENKGETIMEDVYKELCKTMAKRGGLFPGMDIPEFYVMTRELFSTDEAVLSNAMPRGFNSAEAIAEFMERDVSWVEPILEAMSQKGLCFSTKKGDATLYAGPPFVPGIFEYQFMRGTATERDKKLAHLIHDYKSAVDKARKPMAGVFPAMRVITVDHTIKADNQIHTYDQVKSYIEKYDALAVSTCYCRHQARLIDEQSHCGSPDEVCLQFGDGATFVIEKKMGRPIEKEEALEILNLAEKAGLVHCTNNSQEIDFLCNCCACHCVILKNAKAYAKPGLAVNSGFQPVWHTDLCTACETCVDRCPMDALQMGAEDLPELDPDQCIGCGVCATGCPVEAIEMEQRSSIPSPPVDRRALKSAIKASIANELSA
jgi:Pyruvate/2-oxoacid:ferredoxin oxidoreductase delta subunit